MTEEQKQNIIDEILEEFDFDRVYRVMVMLDWRWCLPVGERTFEYDHIQGNMRTPTLDELKNSAARILRDVMKSAEKNTHETVLTGSGGLMAYAYYEDTLDMINIDLTFQVTSWFVNEFEINRVYNKKVEINNVRLDLFEDLEI